MRFFTSFVLILVVNFSLQANTKKVLSIADESILFHSVNGYGDGILRALKKGANVNSKDIKAGDEGETPLLKAAANGDVETVKLLLEHGADINAIDDRAESALLSASYLGHYELVKFLIENGANIENPGNKGYTPLYVAAYKGYYNIVDLLLQKGANIHVKAKSGYNIVMASWRYPDLMEYFIVKGVDVNAQTNIGVTALMLSRDEQTTKMLIKHGADILAKTKGGKDALDLSFWAENALTLIQNGANVDRIDNMGNTYLQRLLISWVYNQEWRVDKKLELIEVICKRTKLLNHKNKDGLTAYDLAMRKYKPEKYLKLLSGHGAKSGFNKYHIDLYNAVNNNDYEKYLKLIPKVNMKNFISLYEWNQFYYESREATKLVQFMQDQNVFIPEIMDVEPTIACRLKKENLMSKYIYTWNPSDMNKDTITRIARKIIKNCSLKIQISFLDKLKSRKDEIDWYRVIYRSGDYKIIDWMLKNRFPLASEQHNLFLLYRDVMGHHEKEIQMIYEMGRAGYNLNASYYNGDTLLSSYVSSLVRTRADSKYIPEFMETIEKLLELGLDPNAGRPVPIVIAVRSGSIPLVKLLIKYRVNVDVQLLEGYSPLVYAYMGGHAEMMKLLIEAGANENDLKFWKAMDSNDTEVVKKYLNNGLVVGFKLLAYAIDKGSHQLMQVLINAPRHNLEYPLVYWAVFSKYNYFLSKLLYRGYFPNPLVVHYSSAHDTPIKKAISNGATNLVKILLTHVDDINHIQSIMRSYITMLDIAQYPSKDTPIIDLLLQHGAKTGKAILEEQKAEFAKKYKL
ncbi:MAG: ankyrin repeat domain-containing protein [Leptospirales bacterium]